MKVRKIVPSWKKKVIEVPRFWNNLIFYVKYRYNAAIIAIIVSSPVS